MVRGELVAVEACMAALYLRGVERPWPARRSRWPRTLSALCSAGAPIGEAADSLRSAGLADEAALLAAMNKSGSLGRAAELVLAGHALTAASPWYPPNWRVALGSSAPPALWCSGRPPAGRWAAVLGSREPTLAGLRAAGAAATALVGAGACVASGGCRGVDRAAVRAALRAGGGGRVVEVLACGIAGAAPLEGVLRLSASPPSAQFTPGHAAERNALLYALGRAAVVVEPRLRVGGSWHGALDALRRRLAVVALPAEAAGSGGHALAALGGVWLSSAGQAAALLGLEPPQPQPGLFGAGEVRETLAWGA